MTNERPGRSAAEWVTFAVSALVLALVVVLIAANVGRDDPPSPVVEVLSAEITARGGGFHVPVDVHNDGGAAATDVQVQAELVGPGGTATADQTIASLGVDERVRLVFVFAEDPTAGELTVGVGAFTVP